MLLETTYVYAEKMKKALPEIYHMPKSKTADTFSSINSCSSLTSSLVCGCHFQR